MAGNGGLLGPLAQMGVLGLAAILLLVLVFIAGSKWAARQFSDEERADTEDRMREASKAGQERSRVAHRDKPKRWPITTKLFIVAAIGATILTAYAIYTYAQSGGPSSMAYATELTAGTYGIILIATGIWLTRKQDRKAGELTVIIEQEDANHQETFKYERDRVQKHTYKEHGEERTALLLPLLRDHRIFGLFWRRLLSADRDELRGRDHRRPEDRVLARVEIGDESVTWDQESGEITLRASGKEDVDAPNKHWDYEFTPSMRHSEAEVSQLQQDKEELQQSVADLSRRLGILSENMQNLEIMLENADHFGSQRLQEQWQTAMEMTLGLDRGQMEMNQLDPDELSKMHSQNGFARHPGNGKRDRSPRSEEQSAD